MPKQLKNPKKRGEADGADGTAPDADLEKELKAAEAEVASGPPSEEDPEEDDDADDQVPEEDQAPEMVEPKTKGRRGRGRRSPEATISVAARGPANKVRDALNSMTGANEERISVVEDDESEVDDDSDQIAELLLDARHKVVVSREFPRRWKGVQAAGRCDTYKCPTTLDTIKEDLFGRYGGKTFYLSIHPNSSTGEAKTIAAIQIENPDTAVPLNGQGELLVPEDVVEDPIDPTLMEDPDPAARAEASITRQIEAKERIARLKNANKLLKTMDEDDNEKPVTPFVQDDTRVQALEKRLADMTVEQKMDRRMERLEQMILAQAENGGGKKGGLDGQTQLLIAMMGSADKKFETMMATFMPILAGQNKKTDDFESSLMRFAKVKEVLGSENSKVKGLEARIMEKMMDRYLDGDERGDGSVESGVVDVAKTAIKEGVPLVRAIVDQRGQANQPQGPTMADFQRAVAEQAQKIVKTPEFVEKLRQEWAAQGYVVKLPPLPGENPALVDKSGKPPAAPVTEKKEEKVEEDDEMDTPPGPSSPNYDRKKAVNFVLDTMIEEMGEQKDGGFAVGDILDRLDEELLRGLLNVNTGEDLEVLIGVYADPEKLGEIKAAGQLNPAVKDWLAKVIMSAKVEYRQALEKAGKKEREDAAAAEAKKAAASAAPKA